MRRVDPYKEQYAYEQEPGTAGAVLFVSVLAAIIVTSLVWAGIDARYGAPNTPVAASQPTPRTTAIR